MRIDEAGLEVISSNVEIALNVVSENAHINVMDKYFGLQVTPQKNL